VTRSISLKQSAPEFSSPPTVPREDRGERIRMPDQATEYMESRTDSNWFFATPLGGKKIAELPIPQKGRKTPKALTRIKVEDGAREEFRKLLDGSGRHARVWRLPDSYSRDIPTRRLCVDSGAERTNCKARSASESRPSASPTNSGQRLLPIGPQEGRLAINVDVHSGGFHDGHTFSIERLIAESERFASFPDLNGNERNGSDCLFAVFLLATAQKFR